MGAIVLDTNAVVRAVLSPAGARRKLWLLLVYGGAVHRAKRISEELQLAGESGFRVSGVAEDGLRRAKASIEAIAGLLPSGAPDDLFALASPALLGEYHRKLHHLCEKVPRPPWTQAQIESAYRAFVAACGEITSAFDANEVPRYTEGRDRDDDIVIHTALIGSAPVLISNDMRDVSLDRDGETEYSDDHGNVVRAMTFEHFAATHLDLDLDTVDGARLAEAYDIVGSG